MLVARTYLNICSKPHVSVLGFAVSLSAVCYWNTYVLMHSFARRIMTPILPCLLILVFLCSVLLPHLKFIDVSFIEPMCAGIVSQYSDLLWAGSPVVEFQLVRFSAPFRAGSVGHPVFGTIGTGSL